MASLGQTHFPDRPVWTAARTTSSSSTRATPCSAIGSRSSSRRGWTRGTTPPSSPRRYMPRRSGSACSCAASTCEHAVSRQQLVILDAEETLSKFMVGGMPDAALFKTAVGDLIDRLSRADGTTRFRAYGEMVDCLWKGGNHLGALALEDLWNDLQGSNSFSLLCGLRDGPLSQAGRGSSTRLRAAQPRAGARAERARALRRARAAPADRAGLARFCPGAAAQRRRTGRLHQAGGAPARDNRRDGGRGDQRAGVRGGGRSGGAALGAATAALWVVREGARRPRIWRGLPVIRTPRGRPWRRCRSTTACRSRRSTRFVPAGRSGSRRRKSCSPAIRTWRRWPRRDGTTGSRAFRWSSTIDDRNPGVYVRQRQR